MHTAYHPFYTYTFEGFDTIPLKTTQRVPQQYETVTQLKYNRPMFANGVMKLYKEDIKIYYLGNKRQLRVIHPLTKNKSGFVVFSIHDMPDSQDTKTIYSSFVILEDTGIMNCGDILKTCKLPYIMYLNKNGYLSEYKGK